MSNNDILRRIRYIFDFDDQSMIELFVLAGNLVTRSQVSNWMKKDDDPAYTNLSDSELSVFLDGLIILKRGASDNPTPKIERLNNNIIFRKLKIALNLKNEDILETLILADFKISKHELSAFFRNPGQSQYRRCNDQIIRYFLNGLQIKYRDNKGSSIL